MILLLQYSLFLTTMVTAGNISAGADISASNQDNLGNFYSRQFHRIDMPPEASQRKKSIQTRNRNKWFACTH